MISFLPENMDAFFAQDEDQPIFMLNLLRFDPDGGREKYRDYLACVAPIMLWHGSEMRFAGERLTALGAEYGQAWDAIALIKYPNRSAFANLIVDPDYAAADTLRSEAVRAAVFQPLRKVSDA